MTKAKASSIELMPVKTSDREFLLDVYAAGREIELAMVPWDDGLKRAFVEHQFIAQTEHYNSEYKNVSHEVILVEGNAAGRLYLSRGDDLTAILDITLLPAFRRRGIATRLIRLLQDESCPLRIFVEPWNPSQKLFIDLGFTIVSQDDANLRLEWQPESQTANR